MKRCFLSLVIIFFITLMVSAQQELRTNNPSYRYNAPPGFVNIAELGYGSGIRNTEEINTNFYAGVTYIFGYQIDRHFLGGIGTGIYLYETTQLFPLFLEYRYNLYFRKFTPFFYGDGGALLNLFDLYRSKIFINPGVGINRSVSPKFDVLFSVGLMIQARTMLNDASYVNFKLGISFRENSYRMFKP